MTNLQRICKMMGKIDNGEELSRRKTYIKSSVFYGDGKGIYRKTYPNDRLDLLTAIKVEDVWVLNNGGGVGELVNAGYTAALTYLSERSKDPGAMSKRKELPLVSGVRVQKTYTYGLGAGYTHTYTQCVGIYTPVQSLIRAYSDAEAKYEALKKKDGVRGTKYHQIMEDAKWVIERLLAAEIESGIADV